MNAVAGTSELELRWTQGRENDVVAGATGWEDRFHRLLAAALCSVAAISVAGYLCWDLTADFAAAWPLLVIVLGLLAVAGQYRLRGEQKCFHVVMMAFWAIMVTNCHYFPMYMAARRDVRLSDPLLARCDEVLGVNVAAIREALEPYETLNTVLLFIYVTLVPLMIVATVVPPMLNRMDKAKQYVLACIVSAAISLPIFSCLPAIGPWEHYGFPPTIASLSEKAGIFAALKSPGLFVIDLTNRDGLITFPSFHVVLTVLAAAALWPFRRLRWPAAIWATLIVVSTVATGIHYFVDVLGGLAVAVVASLLASAYLRWEQRPGTAGRRSSGQTLATESAAPPLG